MARKKIQSPTQPEPSNQLYWRNPTFLMGYGLLKGLAEPDHIKVFLERTANVPNFNPDKWLTTKQPNTKTKQILER